MANWLASVALFVQLLAASAPTKSFKVLGKTVSFTLSAQGAVTGPVGKLTLAQILALIPVLLAGQPINEQFRIGADLYQLTVTVS
jgi:hypothetical protein